MSGNIPRHKKGQDKAYTKQAHIMVVLEPNSVESVKPLDPDKRPI